MMTMDELAAAAAACTDRELRKRIDIVRMLTAGFGHVDVARMKNCGRSTVADVWQRYQRGGLEALNDRRRRGLRLSPDQAAELERALAGPAPDARGWTRAAVRRWLVLRFDRRVSDHRAQQLLAAVVSAMRPIHCLP
jgi:transposase